MLMRELLSIAFLSCMNVYKKLFLGLHHVPSKHLCADVFGELVFGVLPMTFG